MTTAAVGLLVMVVDMPRIYLALRKTAASNATRWQRIFAALTRWRLCSNYCHGGIVINSKMHHMTYKDGLHVSDFDKTKWDVYELPDYYSNRLYDLFSQYKQVKYDWFSLLGFVLPWRITDSRRMYCFEWCARVMGMPVRQRITPEDLLIAVLHQSKNIKGGDVPIKKDGRLA